MFLPSCDMAIRIAKEQRQDFMRQAETHRLLRQAGIDQRGWSSRQACWLLSRLGRLLVILGQRLERYYEVPPRAALRGQRVNEASPSG